MNYSAEGAIYHENLTARLKKCCEECVFKPSNKACKKSKTDCCFYNTTIAEFVVTTYPNNALKRIPAESYVRGLHAHGYSGEVRQTSVIRI